MHQSLRRFVFVASTVIGVSCATMRTGVYVASAVDFAPYRTFAWGAPDALPAGDARLDQNPYFKDYLHGAVEKGFAARRIDRVDAPDTADLLIHYHASVTRRLDVTGADRAYGYCDDPECRGHVFTFEAGTIILDVVDARTNRLIWRGWAQDSIEGVLDRPDRLRRQIDDAVARMLRELPARQQ